MAPLPRSPTPLRDVRQSLLLSLRHRPLVWTAVAVALGCALGPAFAAISGATEREALILLAPLAIGTAGACSAYRSHCRRESARTRVALFLALGAVFTTHAARRWLPPTTDVSTLTRQPVPAGPQSRVPVRVRGWIGDYPQRSDFNVSFPVECAQVSRGQAVYRGVSGRVWVEAPLEATVEVGDEVTLDTELADLPRPGNPGEQSARMSTVADNCWCLAKVKHADEIRVVPGQHAYGLDRWIADVRRALLQHYETAFAGPDRTHLSHPYPRAMAQLLGAMVFGQGGLQDPLPFLTRNQFRAAGLSHVLVASGTQVAFLTLMLIGVGRMAGLRRWWLLVLVLPVLLLYALITGGGPSIWRATIGGACVVWALLQGRDIDGLSLWSLALAAVLVADPIQLFSISLQLTFAATWGLIMLSPLFVRLLGSRSSTVASPADAARADPDTPTTAKLNPLGQLFALSLSAQAATLPVLLYHFGRLSTAGLGANFVAVPLAELLVGTGILGLVWNPVNALNYPMTRGIANLATFAATAPGAQSETGAVSLRWVVSLYALMMLCASGPPFGGVVDRHILAEEARRWWRRKRAALAGIRVASLVVVIALGATVYVTWRTVATHAPALRVTLLDVGQGESIIVSAPSGRTVVIDGGSSADEGRGEAGRAIIEPFLQSLGADKVDALVITHSDADHCNGLTSVVSEVPVGMALDGSLAEPSPSAALHHSNGGPDSAEAHAQVREALRVRGIPVYPARPGQTIRLGDGITLTDLAPTQPPLHGDNNNGAVLRLDYGTTSMLLTADIESEAEERLVRRGANLRCTVLKLAHHGSKTSTTPLLLDAARPQAAILSCGRYNKFGHPAAAVLARLTQRHIPVYRTDRDGAIDVYSDGHQCWIQTFR